MTADNAYLVESIARLEAEIAVLHKRIARGGGRAKVAAAELRSKERALAAKRVALGGRTDEH